MIALLSFAMNVTAQDGEKIIRKGNRNYRKSNYSEAVANYKEALKKSPTNTKALFNLGDAYYGMKQYDSAYVAFQNVVGLSPDAKLRSNALLNMGNCLVEQKRYNEAFDVYKNALKENPDNEDALYNLEYCRAHMVNGHILVDKGLKHGQVKPNKKTAYNGRLVTISSTPDVGYDLSSYVVTRADNPEVVVEMKNANSFVMPRFDVMVSAVFKEKHRIDVEKNIPHGKIISTEEKAIEGKQIALRSQPDEGYLVEKVTVYRTGNRNETVEANKSGFKMPDYDVTVTATFALAYKIGIKDSIPHGSVSADKREAIAGDKVNLKAQGDPGYALERFVVVKAANPKDSLSVEESSFTMPKYDVTVSAVFRQQFKVSVDASPHGTIEVSDSMACPQQLVRVIVKPDKGYQLDELKVVGDKDPNWLVAVADTNVFEMPEFDVTVKGSFVKATDYFKVQADTATEGGRVLLEQAEATFRESVKLKNEPDSGYRFKEYVIHQLGDTAVKITPFKDYFTMPYFDVEVSAVFEKNQDNQNQNQQQQEQQEQQQDQQSQQDQQDQQKDQQDQQEQQQDQQDQQKDQQKDEQKGQQPEQGQQPPDQQMSKEDALRMLEALENQEKKTLEKVNELKVRQQPKKKTDKDW